MTHSPGTYKDIISKAGVSLDEQQFARLDHYAHLLAEWNVRVNLVSRKDTSNIWPAHLLHSLTPLMSAGIPEGARIADLGSGGGLPGIPLAIALPHAKVVLIESIRKKCVALSDIVRRLKLDNTIVLNARAEEAAAMTGHKSSFDLVTARAVAPLADLVRWSSPLVRRDRNLSINFCGKEILSLPALIAMKGGPMDQEIDEARKTGDSAYLRFVPIKFEGSEGAGLAGKSLIIIGL